MQSHLMYAMLVILLAGAIQAEESYLCVSNMATGFKLAKDGVWRQTNFKADRKYLVKEPVKGDDFLSNYAFVVEHFGEGVFSSMCKRGLGRIEYISCEGLHVEGENVFVEIGKCSPL